MEYLLNGEKIEVLNFSGLKPTPTKEGEATVKTKQKKSTEASKTKKEKKNKKRPLGGLLPTRILVLPSLQIQNIELT